MLFTATKGEVSILRRDYDLSKYVHSLLQMSEKLVKTTITGDGYLATESIMECLKISSLDSVIGKVDKDISGEAFTGGIMMKSSLGKVVS